MDEVSFNDLMDQLPNEAELKPVIPRETVEDLEVQIKVELGQLKIKIGELVKIKRHQILSLEKTMLNEVFLTLHNNIIARGKLVEVDDRFGVQIISLVKEKGQSAF